MRVLSKTLHIPTSSLLFTFFFDQMRWPFRNLRCRASSPFRRRFIGVVCWRSPFRTGW